MHANAIKIVPCPCVKTLSIANARKNIVAFETLNIQIMAMISLKPFCFETGLPILGVNGSKLYDIYWFWVQSKSNLKPLCERIPHLGCRLILGIRVFFVKH
jgi:hypothetical protein